MTEIPASVFGFVVNQAGTCWPLLREQDRLDLMGVAPATSAAYDLLSDDGMPAAKVAEIVLGMQRFHKQGGPDIEAQARKLLRLRRAVR